jgi:hypothetical protein
MSAHECQWDFEEECESHPLYCGEPASVRIRQKWYCEEHADEVERILALDGQGGEEKVLRDMEPL